MALLITKPRVLYRRSPSQLDLGVTSLALGEVVSLLLIKALVGVVWTVL